MRFQHFLGIDQTGAVRAGIPLPLKAALLERGPGRSWRLTLLRLPYADYECVSRIAPPGKLALVLDCVFGLPDSVLPRQKAGAEGIWRLMQSAAQTPGYGLCHSEPFFDRLRNPRDKGNLPRRKCELAARANSVFSPRPFQRNIQTGTFRFWRDLTRGQARRWFNLWPFDDPRAPSIAQGPWLFEGFPSLLWTRLFGFKARAPKLFVELLARTGARIALSRQDLRTITRDADFADASALALGAMVLQNRRRLLTAPPTGRLEGWIVGLD